jgi:hypothetical protein
MITLNKQVSPVLRESPIFLEFCNVAYFFTFHWRLIFHQMTANFLTSNVDYSDLYLEGVNSEIQINILNFLYNKTFSFKFEHSRD